MRLDSVAGRFSSSAGTKTCAVMIVATPASIAALNGTNSTCAQPLGRMLDQRQFEMRIGAGVAVTREMLAAGGDALRLQRADDRGAEPGDLLGLVPRARDRR